MHNNFLGNLNPVDKSKKICFSHSKKNLKFYVFNKCRRKIRGSEQLQSKKKRKTKNVIRIGEYQPLVFFACFQGRNMGTENRGEEIAMGQSAPESFWSG